MLAFFNFAKEIKKKKAEISYPILKKKKWDRWFSHKICQIYNDSFKFL